MPTQNPSPYTFARPKVRRSNHHIMSRQITRRNLRVPQTILLHPDRSSHFVDSRYLRVDSAPGHSPTALRSAREEPEGRNNHLIDKDHARLGFVDEALLLALIVASTRWRLRPNRLPSFGDPNRFVRVFHLGRWRPQGPNRFFPIRRRITRNVRQNRRRIKTPGSPSAGLLSRQKLLCAGVDRSRTSCGRDVTASAVAKGPTSVSSARRIAQLQALHHGAHEGASQNLSAISSATA